MKEETSILEDILTALMTGEMLPVLGSHLAAASHHYSTAAIFLVVLGFCVAANSGYTDMCCVASAWLDV